MTLSGKHSSTILGVILAGGGSSRMGGNDKFLLSLGGKKILDHIIDRLAPQVDKLILNAFDPGHAQEFAIEVVPDIKLDEKPVGPMGGLYTVLTYAENNGFSRVVTVPCDTPFIPDNFLARLLAHKESPIVVAKSKGRIHPVLGLWHVSLRDDLRTAIENNQRKMMSWLSTQSVAEVCWDEEPDPFFNINRAEDLAIAEKRLSLKGGH